MRYLWLRTVWTKKASTPDCESIPTDQDLPLQPMCFPELKGETAGGLISERHFLTASLTFDATSFIFVLGRASITIIARSFRRIPSHIIRVPRRVFGSVAGLPLQRRTATQSTIRWCSERWYGSHTLLLETSPRASPGRSEERRFEISWK